MAHRLRTTSTEGDAGSVVDLGAARDRQRWSRYQERIDLVLGEHRRALSRLFESGLVFSRHGAKIGQELLRAQQHLMRLSDVVGRHGGESGALVDEIEALLEKTSALARRNKELFQAT